MRLYVILSSVQATSTQGPAVMISRPPRPAVPKSGRHLAAGADQVYTDRLHPQPARLRRAALGRFRGLRCRPQQRRMSGVAGATDSALYDAKRAGRNPARAAFPSHIRHEPFLNSMRIGHHGIDVV